MNHEPKTTKKATKSAISRVRRAIPSGWGLAALPVAFLVSFFVVPVCLLVVMSFLQGKSFQVEWTWNVANYSRILFAEGFWKVVYVGLKNGLMTAIISLLLCFPIAWYMTYKTRSNALLYAVLLSWFSSYLVRIYAWRTILGTNGVINTFLLQAGLVSEPIPWLIFSSFATVVALVHIMVPFSLLILVSALKDVKQDFLDAARDLGAPLIYVLPNVVIPMAYKGIIGSFMFTFILASGDFIVPQLLGGRDGVTAGLLISNQFRSAGNWPFGAAMAFILLATFAAVYLVVIALLYVLRLSPGRRYHEE